jgi:hypothetical protein
VGVSRATYANPPATEEKEAEDRGLLEAGAPDGAKAVGRYLEGIRFPIRKQDLVAQLERNGVPGPVLSQLGKRLPEGEYRGPQDVIDALRRGGAR